MLSDEQKKEIVMFSILGVLIIGFLVFFVVTIDFENSSLVSDNFEVISGEKEEVKVEKKEIKSKLFENPKFNSLRENSYKSKEFEQGVDNPFEPF